jgi:hypothetical protein
MKIQMIVAAVIMVALASSNDYTWPNCRTPSSRPAAAGYIENRTLSAMMLVWKPDDIGVVAGVMGVTYTATSAVATSTYSSILTTEAAKYMPHYAPEAAITAGLPSSSTPALFQGITNGTFSTIPGITNAISTHTRLISELSFYAYCPSVLSPSSQP